MKVPDHYRWGEGFWIVFWKSNIQLQSVAREPKVKAVQSFLWERPCWMLSWKQQEAECVKTEEMTWSVDELKLMRVPVDWDVALDVLEWHVFRAPSSEWGWVPQDSSRLYPTQQNFWVQVQLWKKHPPADRRMFSVHGQGCYWCLRRFIFMLSMDTYYHTGGM